MKDIFSDRVLSGIEGAIDQSMSARTFGVGEVIADRYKVERVVGRGNFGYVYRVLDEQSGKKLALKSFYEKFTSRKNAGDDLQQLGHSLKDLRHPNLVRVLDVGHQGDLLFFVEEFVSSFTLDQVVDALRKHKPDQGFPAEEMETLFNQTVAALDAASELLHLNLSPRNIFTSKSGIKVSDLGIAGVLRNVLTKNDLSVMSGLRFWAPEFIHQGEKTRAADVYSLGKILVFLLTLNMPGQDVALAAIKGRHPRALMTLASNACDADPDQRPTAPRTFYGAFEAARRAPLEEPIKAAEITTEDRLAEAAQEALDAVSESFSAREIHVAAPSIKEIPKVAAEPVVERPLAAERAGEVPSSVGEALEEVERQFFGETQAIEEVREALAPGELPALEKVVPSLSAEAPPMARERATAVAPMARPTIRKPFPWVAAAAIFLVALGLILGLVFRDRIWPPSKSMPISSQSVENNTFNLEGVVIKPEPGGPTFQEMVDALLQQAQTYMDTNQLTDPPNDSAFTLYSLVLEMDQKNKTALAGLEAIQNRYALLGRAFMNKNELRKAEWQFHKVLQVNPQNAEARSALQKIAELSSKPGAIQGEPPGLKTPENMTVPQPTPPAVAISGPITGDIIKQTIAKYMGRVQFCFAKNPEASGEVKLRFVINPTGKVSDAGVASSTLSNAEIEQCLVRRVSLMEFPAFQGSPKNVTYPFRFNQ